MVWGGGGRGALKGWWWLGADTVYVKQTPRNSTSKEYPARTLIHCRWMFRVRGWGVGEGGKSRRPRKGKLGA